MQFIKPDVQTICVGIAMSMGALLLAGRSEGKRMALPNAKILIHQVWTPHGPGGQAADIEIRARETPTSSAGSRRSSPSTPARISRRSRTTPIATTSYRREAKDYGIIDTVITSRDGGKALARSIR